MVFRDVSVVINYKLCRSEASRDYWLQISAERVSTTSQLSMKNEHQQSINNFPSSMPGI